MNETVLDFLRELKPKLMVLWNYDTDEEWYVYLRTNGQQIPIYLGRHFKEHSDFMEWLEKK